jgi:hypothetical protein
MDFGFFNGWEKKSEGKYYFVVQKVTWNSGP